MKGEKQCSPENLNKLEQSLSKQNRLRERVCKSRAYTDEERAALGVNSQDAFEQFWSSALTAKANFDAQHEHGLGRVSKGATNLASSAYGFLEYFRSMLEIITDFSAPYGSMAIGTLCFLFAVAKNRTKMEGEISATLQHIRDRLPSVQMYQHIYIYSGELGQQLQTKIVDAYNSFIDFCIAAVNFYSRHSFYRWIAALRGTGEVGTQAALVQDAMVQVRFLCEDLLNQNVNDVKDNLKEVKTINIEQQRHIHDLKEQLSVLQTTHDFETLEKVRKLLRLEPFSAEAHLKQLDIHRSNVRDEFRKNWYPSETSDEESDAVLKNPSYEEWRWSPSSQLLILSGKNYSRHTTHCWVSPVALDLAANFTASNDPNTAACVFYLLGRRKEEDTYAHVMTFLTHQLLSVNKGPLQDKPQFDEMWSALNSYEAAVSSPSGDRHKIREKLRDAALRALNMFGAGKTVWIILDRVDQCRPEPHLITPRNYPGRDSRALLAALVYLVEQATVTVKVLTVVNRLDWAVEEQLDEFGRSKEGSMVHLPLLQCGQSRD
ncbi:hypothetical protein JDV02_009759 [Purpureocillium takamizusanense]|uniref:Uncharacterized protein n=1 Tax=Purpureocillium takamizusanense TaxID=2060973 RepID=A0A9Q8VGJ3_9HYPO|nr:uncharacterized protein JDV02_009759 [Purpureocillium takamizusanense]UNI23974.1 hypothetical protein JDV02_009759 [Purpureocillium takamizusanense]